MSKTSYQPQGSQPSRKKESFDGQTAGEKILEYLRAKPGKHSLSAICNETSVNLSTASRAAKKLARKNRIILERRSLTAEEKKQNPKGRSVTELALAPSELALADDQDDQVLASATSMDQDEEPASNISAVSELALADDQDDQVLASATSKLENASSTSMEGSSETDLATLSHWPGLLDRAVEEKLAAIERIAELDTENAQLKEVLSNQQDSILARVWPFLELCHLNANREQHKRLRSMLELPNKTKLSSYHLRDAIANAIQGGTN
jgi:hypothetical protein